MTPRVCPNGCGPADESQKFCRVCGTRLVTQAPPTTEAASEQTVQPLCPNCGSANPPGKRFCRHCGSPLAGSPESSVPATAEQISTGGGPETVAPEQAAARHADTFASAAGAASSSQQATQQPRPFISPTFEAPPRIGREPPPRAESLARPVAAPKTRPLPLILGAVGLVVILVLGYFFYFSPLKGVMRAAEAGNLVTPPGSSAYDMYLAMKRDGLSPTDLGELRSNILPLLRSRGDASYQQWHDRSNLSPHDWQNLERIYAWAVELSPGANDLQAKLAYARGQIEFNRGNYTQATTYFREANRLLPEWTLTFNALGRTAVRMKNYDDAEGYYKRALSLEPNWVYSNLNLAGVYFSRRQFDMAAQYYERTVQLAPEKAFGHAQLGLCYEQLARYGEAHDQYQQALQLVQRQPEEGVSSLELAHRIARAERKLR